MGRGVRTTCPASVPQPPPSSYRASASDTLATDFAGPGRSNAFHREVHANRRTRTLIPLRRAPHLSLCH